MTAKELIDALNRASQESGVKPEEMNVLIYLSDKSVKINIGSVFLIANQSYDVSKAETLKFNDVHVEITTEYQKIDDDIV